MRRLQFPVNQCLMKLQHFKKFSLTVASSHLKYGIFVPPRWKFIATVEDSKKITGNFKSSASFDSSMLWDSTFFNFFFFPPVDSTFSVNSLVPDLTLIHCIALLQLCTWQLLILSLGNERHCVSANKCKLGN